MLLVNALTGGYAGGRVHVPPAGVELRSAVTEALRAASESFDDLPLVSEPDARALAAAAPALREVFTADTDDDAADRVNSLLARTAARPSLDRHDGQGWHLHYLGTSARPGARWLGSCAAALAVVVAGGARSRLGVCTATRCDRVYVDTSHNGTRRFCSTACQNRAKTAAFRARSVGGELGSNL